MRILVCSTPRSRSTIFNEYLVKKYDCHNHHEKLNFPHESSSSIHPNFFIKKSRKEFYIKKWHDQINEIFSHQAVVAKLWGTMLTYTNNYKPFICGPLSRTFPLSKADYELDYDQQFIFQEISKLIPFDRFDKIYYLQRDIYDVASSWFYHAMKANDMEYKFKYDCKTIICRAVLDVLLLEKLKKFLTTTNRNIIELSFDEIPDHIKEFTYRKQPNNINYSTAIGNHDQLIDCVNECIQDYRHIDDLEFS